MLAYTVSYGGVVEEVIQSSLPDAAAVKAAIESGKLYTAHYSPAFKGHVSVTAVE